jgi:hypothetical protein
VSYVERNRGELGFPQSLDRAERSGFACLVWSRFLHQVWVFFWEGRGEEKGGKYVDGPRLASTSVPLL